MSTAALDTVSDGSSPRRLAPILWALLALFVLRVVGQALVVFFHVRWLPPAREWYSGLIAYPLLLPAQSLIIALLAFVCRDFTRGRGWFVMPRPRLGRWVSALGIVYFSAMVVRYATWMTLHPEARWLHGTIPILLHCVLAMFLIVFGRYHLRSVASTKGAAA